MTMTNQPKWKCIAQLGDVNPLDYGGYWVLIDTTGAYPAEGEYLTVDEIDGKLEFTAWRFPLDRCTLANGILSDNQYHPDKSAWFAPSDTEMIARPQDGKGLYAVADFVGIDHADLVAMFCSDNPVDRAIAYRAIGDFYGFDNLDSYPLTLTRSEARKRYSRAMYRVREHSAT